MTTHAQKIRGPASGYFLITQPGEEEIDFYSLIVRVPPLREAAFLRAVVKKGFSAKQFGEVVHYSVGELTLLEAKTIATAHAGA